MNIRLSRLAATFMLYASFNAMGQGVDVIGIDHIALRVANIDTSANWYEARFGFIKIREWKGVRMIGKGAVRIGLFLVPTPTPPSSAANEPSRLVADHFALNVAADRFQDTIDRLRAAGVKLTEVEDTGIAYSVFMTDPDGYRVELTTYHSPAATPPK